MQLDGACSCGITDVVHAIAWPAICGTQQQRIGDFIHIPIAPSKVSPVFGEHDATVRILQGRDDIPDTTLRIIWTENSRRPYDRRRDQFLLKRWPAQPTGRLEALLRKQKGRYVIQILQ